MNRDTMLAALDSKETWDIIIIGGGATGLGTAVDAASRGYKTLLLEQHDFAKGTSSRSTKLVHGGVRYLQQGNLTLVIDALKERGLLLENAPHLVKDLPFIVPNYEWWEAPFYGIGLRVYDMLAGKLGFGRSRNLSLEETVERIPKIETESLRGGVVYHDGQFDDARLAINLAETAADQGGILINYMPVTGLMKDGDMVQGVEARDEETDTTYKLFAKVVINATGVFTDTVRHMDDPEAEPMLQLSQGIHIVLDRSFLVGDTAIMVPHTDDGLVLFAIPWHHCTIVGTTDTPVDTASLEPRALPDEIDFIMTHAARYLTKDPTPADVLSVFAGLRPLVKSGTRTSVLSRDHTIHGSRAGLVTVTGGKWTTYRKMAEDTIEQAAAIGALEDRPCVTKTLHIHGYDENSDAHGDWSTYGADVPALKQVIAEKSEFSELLHPDLPPLKGEVVGAVRNERARTVEDVLSRRTRCILFNARASIEAAPATAALMAAELGKDDAWVKKQIEDYTELAKGYLFPS